MPWKECSVVDERLRPLYEPHPSEGCPRFWSAVSACPIRSHIFRWSPQGQHAGRIRLCCSGGLCLVPAVAAGRRSHWCSTAQPFPTCLALRGATPEWLHLVT
jgi:hypothetical protein